MSFNVILIFFVLRTSYSKKHQKFLMSKTFPTDYIKKKSGGLKDQKNNVHSQEKSFAICEHKNRKRFSKQAMAAWFTGH